MLTNARRRWPAVDVPGDQRRGAGAHRGAADHRRAEVLDRRPGVDVIVLARGGGSVEDLLPFSDEALCRAVFAARTPVMRAIGHETDAPLVDYVADVRASTPTDAAKRIVPDLAEERRSSTPRGAGWTGAVGTLLDREQHRLDGAAVPALLARPELMIDAPAADVGPLRDRATRSLTPVAPGGRRPAPHPGPAARAVPGGDAGARVRDRAARRRPRRTRGRRCQRSRRPPDPARRGRAGRDGDAEQQSHDGRAELRRSPDRAGRRSSSGWRRAAARWRSRSRCGNAASSWPTSASAGWTARASASTPRGRRARRNQATSAGPQPGHGSTTGRSVMVCPLRRLVCVGRRGGRRADNPLRRDCTACHPESVRSPMKNTMALACRSRSRVTVAVIAPFAGTAAAVVVPPPTPRDGSLTQVGPIAEHGFPAGTATVTAFASSHASRLTIRSAPCCRTRCRIPTHRSRSRTTSRTSSSTSSLAPPSADHGRERSSAGPGGRVRQRPRGGRRPDGVRPRPDPVRRARRASASGSPTRYGIDDIVATDRGVNMTEDVGAVAGAFGQALYGRVGPFLKWDLERGPGGSGRLHRRPGRHHQVVGRPYNTNFVRIEQPRPGHRRGPDQVGFTDLFSVQGRYATNAGVDVDKATYSTGGGTARSRSSPPASPARPSR